MELDRYFDIIENGSPKLMYCGRFSYGSGKWDYSPHYHPYLELIYFLEGTAAVTAAGANMNVSMYDTLIYPAYCEHRDRYNAQMDCEIICLRIDLPGLVLERPILMHGQDHEIRELFLMIHRENTQKNSIPYFNDHALKLLLMKILQDYSEMPENEQFLNDLLLYIDRHYKEKITLESLAGMEHISKSYMTRRFKKLTGTTIVTYINRRRIRAARELLAGSSMGTEEIAYSVGFDSPKYFYRVFKNETGFSPGAFRKMSKNR